MSNWYLCSACGVPIPLAQVYWCACPLNELPFCSDSCRWEDHSMDPMDQAEDSIHDQKEA